MDGPTWERWKRAPETFHRNGPQRYYFMPAVNAHVGRDDDGRLWIAQPIAPLPSFESFINEAWVAVAERAQPTRDSGREHAIVRRGGRLMRVAMTRGPR